MSAKEVTHRIEAIYRYGDTTPATIASILSSFLWAACLFFPGTLIGPPGVGRPTYRYMYEVAGEQTWMLVFASVFVLQSWRLFFSSSCHNCKWQVFTIEIVIKFWAAAVWTFVALACIVAQYPPAAAMSDSIVIAGLCWWDFWRCERRPQVCPGCSSDLQCRPRDLCPYVDANIISVGAAYGCLNRPQQS